MRFFRSILFCIFFLAGCSEEGQDPLAGTCTASETAEGLLVSCPDGTRAILPLPSDGRDGQNGEDGRDGEDGQNGQNGEDGEDGEPGTVVEVIPLCPDISGSFPEVLFRIAGKLYAVYDHSSGERLVEVVPGNYRTTDGRDCNFTVTADLEVVYE